MNRNPNFGVSLFKVVSCPDCGKHGYPGTIATHRKYAHAPLEQSIAGLMEKVDKNGPNGCWIWTGAKNDSGYGLTAWRGNKNIRVHRISYELVNGPIADGMVVMHTCDNRPCCNPEHLRIGTAEENRADARFKDRHCRGERARSAKITPEQAKRIKEVAVLGKGGNIMDLAKEHGVNTNTITSIVSGRSWRHLP